MTITGISCHLNHLRSYSRFKGTVQYIETALQERHPRISALTGHMTEDERRKALDVFRENRGLLVTSLLAVQGLEITARAVVFCVQASRAHRTFTSSWVGSVQCPMIDNSKFASR